LAEQYSSLREVGRRAISAFSWVRTLYTVLAALTGALWAFSVVRFLLATGWPVVFYFGYAAASAGFTVVCALVALNISMNRRLTAIRTIRE
jgi:hypothetical protein